MTAAVHIQLTGIHTPKPVVFDRVDAGKPSIVVTETTLHSLIKFVLSAIATKFSTSREKQNALRIHWKNHLKSFSALSFWPFFTFPPDKHTSSANWKSL